MGKAKILVVDDDEALAEMIGIVLRGARRHKQGEKQG